MAQLKDTIILGDLSTTGNLYTGNAYANSISLNGKADGANNTGYGLNISNAHIGVNTNNSLLAIHSTADVQIRPGNGSIGTNGYIFNTGALYPTVNGTYDIGAPGYRFKSEYLTGTLILGATEYTSPGSSAVGTYIAPGVLEITNSTPYIDFHYNNSGADFTGRIIADNSYGLDIAPRLGVNGAARSDYIFYVNGNSMLNGNIQSTNGFTTYTMTAGVGFQEGSGSAIQIREVGAVTTGQSSWSYAPKIGFHWGGRVARQFGMNSAGEFCFFSQSSETVYATVRAGAVYGAVWNDYAEYRETDTQEFGRCVIENGDDTMSLSTKRLQKGCSITSDTWGFAQGQTEKAKTPIAVSGRVLAYPFEDKEEFKKHIGDAVCSGPKGTVSIMTDEEVQKYPLSIIGTISAVPDYEEWGGGSDRDPVKVNGRVWIRIK